MMPKLGKDQHVVPHDDHWAVKTAGNERVSKTFDTQEEAIEYARERARAEEAEMLIHDEHGRIRERNTYGHDPFPPRG